MRRSAIACALFALLSTAGAFAQEPEEPTLVEARELFARGRELAQQRRFDEAAEAFARSLELAPRASTMFNLGACLYAVGRLVRATEVLEGYVASADPATDAAGVADATRMLNEARRSVAELTLEVRPPDAVVTVDGVPVDGGAVRTRLVDPGAHVVSATAEGHAPMALEITVERGGSTRRALHLTSTRRAAALTIITAGWTDARVRVDERALEGPTVEVEAGSHDIVIDVPGIPRIERRVDVDWNERLRVELIMAERSGTSVLDEPAFWAAALGTGAAVGLAVLIGVLATPTAPDGGSTGVVLSAPAGVRPP